MKKKTTALLFFGLRIKKWIVFLVVIGIVAFLEIFLFLFYGGGLTAIVSQINQRSYPNNEIILFEGKNCVYCSRVEDVIKKNKLEDVMPITRLEVFDNSFNANVLADKAQICGLDSKHIGVPFLWDGKTKKCIVGYVDIIDFLKAKIPKK